MFVAGALVLIGSSPPSRGVGGLGFSALRALMVLPAWPNGQCLGWSELGVAAGVGVFVLALAIALWCRTRDLTTTRTSLSSPFGRVRRPRAR